MSVLTVGLAAVFSSPDEKPITLTSWAAGRAERLRRDGRQRAGRHQRQRDVRAAVQQQRRRRRSFGRCPLQKLGGVRHPGRHRNDLVLGPLAQDRRATRATAGRSPRWTGGERRPAGGVGDAYADALAKAPDNDPAQVAPGDYGPVPALTAGFLHPRPVRRPRGLADARRGSFYGSDHTRSLLLLADGAYLEDQARAQQLGGDQWGMMNETGNYPGQPWMWLYTFWYQVKPFSHVRQRRRPGLGADDAAHPGSWSSCRSSPASARSRAGSRCTG